MLIPGVRIIYCGNDITTDGNGKGLFLLVGHYRFIISVKELVQVSVKTIDRCDSSQIVSEGR